nr:immunoglobulin light chain junction region [Macaca mulatta]MOX53171.1 immunoglobulin light chain junction region [Macaca mulatta]MOX55901.1 immunoglobulin light chain junction region [Macaca mulatta]
CQQYNHWNSF